MTLADLGFFWSSSQFGSVFLACASLHTQMIIIFARDAYFLQRCKRPVPKKQIFTYIWSYDEVQSLGPQVLPLEIQVLQTCSPQHTGNPWLSQMLDRGWAADHSTWHVCQDHCPGAGGRTGLMMPSSGVVSFQTLQDNLGLSADFWCSASHTSLQTQVVQTRGCDFACAVDGTWEVPVAGNTLSPWGWMLLSPSISYQW